MGILFHFETYKITLFYSLFALSCCQLWSFVVIRCTTCFFHSLSLIALVVVTHCHSLYCWLSFVVTLCYLIYRLSVFLLTIEFIKLTACVIISKRSIRRSQDFIVKTL